MRTQVFLSLSIFTSLWLYSPVNASNLPLIITIRVDNPTVKVGSEASISLQLTNLSNKNINCTALEINGMDRSYRYEIRNSKGDLVQKVPRKHPEIGEEGSIYLCSLAPGKSTLWVEERIGTTYNMRQPGVYTVQVWRQYAQDSDEVGSNKITITVTPQE